MGTYLTLTVASGRPQKKAGKQGRIMLYTSKALADLGVSPAYVKLLQAVYSSQVATVGASRAFPLERGVKQGDPISPLLFLAVMEVIFRPLKTRWNKLNSRRLWTCDC